MRNPTLILIALLLALGLAALLYPSISNWYNSQYHIEATVTYDEAVASASDRSLDEELQKARDYNESLAGGDIVDPFIPGGGQELPPDYTGILDVNDGMMGSLAIPSIDVDLPIYHGTSQKVLEKGLGHMEMTAFPIGGIGNHTVLTGHTGLPSSLLLTDLVKVKKGDEFAVKVLKRTLAYRVDQIMVVEPQNTKALTPVPGKDYITLVTCTPYGTNSHRLLVRGEQIPLEESVFAGKDARQSTGYLPPSYLIPVGVGTLVLVIAATSGIIILRRRKMKAKVAEAPTEPLRY